MGMHECEIMRERLGPLAETDNGQGRGRSEIDAVGGIIDGNCRLWIELLEQRMQEGWSAGGALGVMKV